MNHPKPFEKIHGLTDHKVYKTWKRIKSRCYNPNNPSYTHYGGRGIKMQESWISNPHMFYVYVTLLPRYPGEDGIGNIKGKLSLDRIDNNSNYEEGNLRWATPKQQLQNRRPLQYNDQGPVYYKSLDDND